MKQKLALLLFAMITYYSCNDTSDCCVQIEPVNVTFTFSHHWDGVPINLTDFNTFKFTNLHGETISIERLRYVISNITAGDVVHGHHLVNIGEASGLTLDVNQIAQGNTFLKFTFGFADKDNLDGIYQDLNTVSFNVPAMLGGGYHYMQFDGKYIDTSNQEANFNYHAIRAADRSDPNNLILRDTSFEFEIGTINLENDTTIEIKMNVAEWFKNPNTWNLNELNTVLMPNFEAQLLMGENGRNVFSVGEITP